MFRYSLELFAIDIQGTKQIDFVTEEAAIIEARAINEHGRYNSISIWDKEYNRRIYHSVKWPLPE